MGNFAVGLELQFVYVAGEENKLADTLSRWHVEEVVVATIVLVDEESELQLGHEGHYGERVMRL